MQRQIPEVQSVEQRIFGDPKLPADQQDKRSVVVLKEKDYDLWLRGSVEEAKALIRLSPVEIFEAGPAVGTEALLAP